MKKVFFLLIILISVNFVFAQTNNTVNVFDDIYNVIDQAEIRGFCGPLPGARPYTEKKILSILDEILEYEENLSSTEIQIINDTRINVNVMTKKIKKS